MIHVEVDHAAHCRMAREIIIIIMAITLVTVIGV